MAQFDFDESPRVAELVINEMQDALIVRDMEDCIRFWNKGAERLYGWEASEVAGQNYYNVLREGHPEGVRKPSRSLMEKGEWNGELRQVTKACKTVIVESHWRVQRDESTRPTSVIILNRDITHRKLLESHILRANKIETIAKLTSSIAHDLNGVLSTMQISVQRLMEEKSSLNEKYALDLWQFSARQATEMITQLLSLARDSEEQHQPVDITRLIEDTAKVLNGTFPATIQIETAISPGLGSILGNPTPLYQAFLNISLNSRDAMPSGGTLRITAEQVRLDRERIQVMGNPDARPGRFIRVCFADTGMGIPAEAAEKVFDAFYTTKDRNQGNGLGLFSVARIVRSHGGFVQLESSANMGTFVTVFLPAQESRG